MWSYVLDIESLYLFVIFIYKIDKEYYEYKIPNPQVNGPRSLRLQQKSVSFELGIIFLDLIQFGFCVFNV